MHRERYSPQDTARHASKGLAHALVDEQIRRVPAAWWPMRHHAGRLFALRELAREEYERAHWLMQRWDGAMRALADGDER